MSLTRAWAPHFSRTIRDRGRQYFERGHVRLQSPHDGELARAMVKGHGDEYIVTVRQRGGQQRVRCTCPHFQDGFYCKHIWAALLSLEREGGGEPVAALRGADAAPTMPKARKRDGTAAPKRRQEPEWSTRLTLVAAGRDAAAPVLADPKRLIYVVVPGLSVTHGGLVVEVRSSHPTQSGWSKPRPFKFNDEAMSSLADATDRELCGTLLGATWVEAQETGDWSRDRHRRSAFRLPHGAAHTLLRGMIDTGRCVIQRRGGAIAPLRWDDRGAWRLWMVGRETDEGLDVDVELRRDQTARSVQEPILITGGPDGLVFMGDRAAPFDDGGAFRWVVYFRDTSSGATRSRALAVAPADVATFVQRLYMMPHVPQIDLPSHLAPPVRSVAPTPHLAIHRPAGSDAAQPSQLEAQVWFSYGEHRVWPDEPGRFVATWRAGDADAADDDDRPDVISGDMPDDEADALGDEVRPRHEAQQDGTSPDVLTIAAPICRDTELERRSLNLLLRLGLRPSPEDHRSLRLSAKRMPAVVTALVPQGWVVQADKRIVRAAPPPRLSVRSGIDWFELHGGVTYQTDRGEQFVSLPEILAAARAGRAMVSLGDGSQGMLPQQWLTEHGMLTAIAEIENDHLRFGASQATLLDVLLDERELIDVDEQFAEARQRLRRFEAIDPEDAGGDFQGELRAYQRDGLGWLRFLQAFSMGGILADDMGLGKTIQILAMLDKQRQNGELTGPSLVVVPRSVVFNWLDEAQRFTPRLKVAAYSGPERKQMLPSLREYDLVVTSYGLLRRDAAELRECDFHFAILDEAQAIKNPSAQVAKASRLLRAKHRLALTGTPVENHLGDLWSIFEFLNPGMLGSATHFADMLKGAPPDDEMLTFDAEGAGADAAEAVLAIETTEPAPGATAAEAKQLDAAHTAARAVRPFILRRTKQQVLTELPDKTEQTIVCEMDTAQRRLYDELLRYYRGNLLDKLGGGAGGSVFTGGAATGAPMMVLEALLRLRQAACHPGLIDDKRTGQSSAKLETLLENLAELIDEGHKALVFSQFTSMLAIVRRKLDEIGVVYEYLDGKTRDRAQRVKRFQTDAQCPVFLISLKAGGLGLNLTAADYVFILDPWWNPAVEQQAIDRAHRIGQTRHVNAYRLICKDTVEQRIAQLQEKKKKLADAIVGGQQNLLKTLTRADLELLLS